MSERDELYLSDERYVAALKRFRQRIVDGREYAAHDDDEPGFKSSGCTWGLCSEESGDWEYPIDMLFPETKDRNTPKYLEDRQLCPLDMRTPSQELMNGCFHTCRAFQRKSWRKPLDREAVIKLYDQRLREADTILAARGA
ncbi:TPA: hypothetical protein SAY52_005493 [Burkholderia cenocepacia]|uniref:hypothetical protein n=1 Tax=unclassified Burkholderia TaxID=2613784 RepID=UPI00158C9A04|nr:MULTISPECIES: hypothetical protein [unclassified Burkholderia]HEF5874814.1 hypothetical protein [Burkholderia cenocepacia]